MITSVSRGQPFPDVAHRGDLLPIGAQISGSPHSRENYLQEAPRTWTSRGSLLDPYVYSSPLYLKDDIEVALPLESVEMFRWRLRDTALAAAERSGVSQPPVHEMAVEFGAPHPLFTVGGIVSSGWDIKGLPVGSVVYSGHPDKPDLMDVWEANGTRHPTHLMGKHGDRSNGQPVTIYSMPGMHMGEPMPVADDAMLSRAALRAWRVGKAYKHRNSWCGVFENCLFALGITHESVANSESSAYGPGDEVDRLHSAQLPEGTILFWQYRNNGYSVYVRDEASRNGAKTKRVWGMQDNTAHSHDRMVVAQTPEEPMAWNCPGWALAQMPDGVAYRARHSVDSVTLDRLTRQHIESWNYYAITGWPS